MGGRYERLSDVKSVMSEQRAVVDELTVEIFPIFQTWNFGLRQWGLSASFLFFNFEISATSNY